MTQEPILDLDELSRTQSALRLEVFDAPDAIDWSRRHSRFIDAAVQTIYASVEEKLGSNPGISVVAVGGYGREELSPYSDLDLTIIPSDEAAPNTDEAVRELYNEIHRILAVGLQYRIGYAYRIVNDSPSLDGKSRTGFMDCRLICGRQEPLDRFLSNFRESFNAGEFLIDKLRERQQAHAATHDTPLVVEPDLKEGAGGLRSFHAANWIYKAIDVAPNNPTPSFEVVLRYRNYLQAVAQKPVDRLSRQRQAEIADRLNANVYENASMLVQALLDLHENFENAKAAIAETRFTISTGVTAVRGEARIDGRADLADAALGVAFATELGLIVEKLEVGNSTLGYGAKLLQALGKGEPTLRNLDRCGLLSTILPQLTNCRTLMPTDSSHTYTVFEHTIRVIQRIDDPPVGFLSEIKSGIPHLNAIYLAALLHDVGKANTSGPHSETGSAIAESICRNWSLADQTRDLVVWLVREHLLLDRTLRFRDIQNPQTAIDFAAEVRSKERLDALTLLTYADVVSVSSETWTPALESLLKELYARTLHILESQVAPISDPALYRKRLIRELRNEEFTPEAVEDYLRSMPAHYVVSTPPDIIKFHIHHFHRAQSGLISVEFDHLTDMAQTEVTVCCQDHPGLLSEILGTIYALDLSTHGVRASTSNTKPEIALDTISVSFADRPLPPATCTKLASELEAVLSGEKNIEALLQENGKDPFRQQENFTHTYLPGNPGILEFRAPRGKGMGFRLARFITHQKWNIASARFGQWAGRGSAAFYIFNSDGTPTTEGEVHAAMSRQV